MDKMNGMMEEEEGVDLVKNVEEANPYPSADKQFASEKNLHTQQRV